MTSPSKGKKVIKSVFSFQDQAAAVANLKNLVRFSVVNVSHTPLAETTSGSSSSKLALDVPKDAFLEAARTMLSFRGGTF